MTPVMQVSPRLYGFCVHGILSCDTKYFYFVITLYAIKGCYRIDIVSCSHTLTDDQTRVRLMPYEGVDGSDYINANYIDVSCH